jgi:hypothetical protein
MPVDHDSLKKTATKESALFLGLLFVGLLILPLAVYLVGKSVFGEYGGTGFTAFYGTLHSAIRNGEPAVLFLVFSPYVIWQLSRLTIWSFRQSWRRRQQART